VVLSSLMIWDIRPRLSPSSRAMSAGRHRVRASSCTRSRLFWRS